MALTEEARQRLVDSTVEMLEALRRAYIRTPHFNALKHWDQLQERMRLATRTSTSPEEWVTALARSLKLTALDSSASSALEALREAVLLAGGAGEWLALVEAEYAYLIAQMRVRSETRKAVNAAVQSIEANTESEGAATAKKE